MNNEELLQELSSRINAGQITQAEIQQKLGGISVLQNEIKEKTTSHFSVTKMLYVFGVAIVVMGIMAFVSQIWGFLGSFGHIFITLGFGILFALLGSMLLKKDPTQNIGSIFHFIGGLLIPGGALVTLDELSTGVDHPWVVTSTFIIIFAFYMLLNYVHKNAVLTLFAIVNGTAALYLAVYAIDADVSLGEDVYQYLTMMVGLSYLLLGSAFRGGWNKKLISLLYFFGALGLLGASFVQVFDSVFWQMLFFILLIGSAFLAIYLKSRSILVITTFFLIVHTSFITGKYFADSLGWPITLIFLGFAFIGLGYLSIQLNRKYIAN